MIYYFYPEIDSTNEEAKRLGVQGVQDAIIVAEKQLQGKGQQGRIWVSDQGGFYFSFLMRPSSFTFEKVGYYTKKTGEKLLQIIDNISGVKPELEWPNDIILSDKKLGGILIETTMKANSQIPDYVVVGIGINVNQEKFPDSVKYTATSLFQATHRQFDLSPFILQLTKELEDVFAGN